MVKDITIDNFVFFVLWFFWLIGFVWACIISYKAHRKEDEDE